MRALCCVADARMFEVLSFLCRTMTYGSDDNDADADDDDEDVCRDIPAT